MKNKPRYLGKVMSHLLRHEPEKYGIQLDPAGWTEVNKLTRQLHTGEHPVDTAAIEAAVAADPKGRFELSADGMKIRACYGHSVDVELNHKAMIPPMHLYHGTSSKLADAIRSEGLRPMNRRHVHLSEDTSVAAQVGSRKRGELLILEVYTPKLVDRGQLFYHPNPTIWITGTIPPDALREL